MSARRYLLNALWLLAPVMALNVAFAARLPPAYQPEIFWRDIPPALALAENGLRVGLFALPALIPLGWRSRSQWLGLGLFAFGFAVYAASWALLIVAPDGAWSRSGPGFTAPAWTPALWLAGLVVLADESFFPRLRPRWPLAVLATLFLACHFAHAALIFSRVSAVTFP